MERATNGRRRGILAWAGGVLALAALAGSAGAQTPMGTAFTYQGRLADASGPLTGGYDLRFTLFDAATAGNLVGTPVTLNAVAVAGGLFSVSLDFGAPALGASARWLAIEVRPAGAGSFTLLSPRQRLTPAPGAVFSSFTDPANLTSLHAGSLTAGTVPDARLSGAYTQAISLTHPANSFTGDGSGLTNLDAQPPYARTAVVRPVGAPAANGSALLAALAAITTASPANPWLLKIEPGLYHLGASSLVMKPYVDVEGSGEQVTLVSGSGNAGNTVGTVKGADHAELRLLTVENTGGAAYAKAIYLDGVGTRLSRVTARASGASLENQGVYLTGGTDGAVLSDVTVDVSATGSAGCYGVLVIGVAAPTLRNLAIVALGGANAHGVWNQAGAAPALYEVQAQGLGATGINRGMTNIDASPRLWNVALVASGPSTFADGIASFGTSAPRLEHVRAFAASTTGQATGLYHGPGTSPWLTDVSVDAAGGTQAWGINNEGIGSPPMDHVTVMAAGTTDQTATTVGVRNVGGSSPILTHLSVIALRGTDAIGIFNSPGGPVVSHATIRVAGGTNNYGVRSVASTRYQLAESLVTVDFGATAVGIANESSGALLTHVDVQGNGASGLNVGVLNSSATSVNIRSSSLSGFTQAIRSTGTAAAVTVDGSVVQATNTAIANLNTGSVSVGASKLVGFTLNPNGGTVACVASYNASYQALNATCQ